ncbi:hypothetical protein NGM37_18195, partial [Streptomyces sp. TRM76130]|nr:hypothetical protein [Streptomyces sp. TRM76130]
MSGTPDVPALLVPRHSWCPGTPARSRRARPTDRPHPSGRSVGTTRQGDASAPARATRRDDAPGRSAEGIAEG